MYRLVFNLCLLWRLVISRMRSWVISLRGGRINSKCLFGSRVRVDRPWQVSVGTRTQFESDVWIKMVDDKALCEIGEFSFLGRGVEIDVSESVIIGNRVLVAPGVFISDHSHNIRAGSFIDLQGCTARAVEIKDDVWIGAHAVILPGVKIGKGAVVGAGAVVTKDVPDNAVAAGVPARVLRYRQ